VKFVFSRYKNQLILTGIFTVKKYNSKHKSLWNNFVQNSKNASFLFYRDFIEYHQDRFEDFSMLVFKGEDLIALIPANKVDDIVYSHQGLTYGGIVLNDKVEFGDVLNSFQSTLSFLNQQSILEFQLKLLPKIYHTLPSDEIDYLLFKTKAILIKRDLTSVIDAKRKLNIQSFNRKRGLKKAIKHKLTVQESSRFDEFWNEILIPNLRITHKVNPVHSLEEITALKANFPERIRQFNVYNEDKIVAGATVFDTKHVAHVQYISAGSDKQQLGSLDLLFDELIHSVYKSKKYFDFGISNVNKGQNINEGLLSWKESFGARPIVHEIYKVETKNFNELNSVML